MAFKTNLANTVAIQRYFNESDANDDNKFN